MANIDLLRPKILSFEGGYQNYSNDKANYTKDGTLIGTNKGVSASTYELIFGIKPTIKDIQNLTDEQFDQVLEHFASSIKYDDINNQSIADLWFDWIWASGSYYPNIHVQTIVGVTADSIVGNATIEAVNNFCQECLFNQLQQARLDYIDVLIAETPADSQFEQGWKSRVNSYTFTA